MSLSPISSVKTTVYFLFTLNYVCTLPEKGQDKVQEWDLVNTVMNFQVLYEGATS
jgi:hypothetical protein